MLVASCLTRSWHGLRLYYKRAAQLELLFVLPAGVATTTRVPTAVRTTSGRPTRSQRSTCVPRVGREATSLRWGRPVPESATRTAAFCAVVGIEKPVLVGHSLGGMIAVELGARYPSLPRALVLVDPGPIDPLPETIEFFRGGSRNGSKGRTGAEIRREYVHDMGARTDELARWIVDLMCTVPRADRCGGHSGRQ